MNKDGFKNDGEMLHDNLNNRLVGVVGGIEISSALDDRVVVDVILLVMARLNNKQKFCYKIKIRKGL